MIQCFDVGPLKKTQNACFVATPSVGDIVAAASALFREPHGAHQLCICLAEKDAPELDDLQQALVDGPLDFIGGLFPSVLFDGQRYDVGAVIFSFPCKVKPLLVTGLHLDRPDVSLPPDWRAFLSSGVTVAGQGTGRAQATALVLVDGLCRNVGGFLRGLHDGLGNNVGYWGGGAGSLSLQQRPCVFGPQGVYQDAAWVALCSAPSALGVRHGWREIMGPLVATRTDGNRILELNWQAAFDVYKGAVEGDSGLALSRAGFFEIAKGYPFGLRKEGAEAVVRDPIAVDEHGALVCVGEVPENAVLSILKGEARALTAAARQAAAEARRDGPAGASLCLVADCISRAIFLQDGFVEELAALMAPFADDPKPPMMVGALTLGEISSQGLGYLEFFNKTAVVALLGGDVSTSGEG